jgi:DNA-binding response OmpR family regulator
VKRQRVLPISQCSENDKERGQSLRLLVVEDQPKVASFLVQGLREERYAVDLAIDGDEAVHMARITDYDVIVLDVMLPRRNGFDVARTLRGNGCESCILMLTAKNETKDAVEGLDAGADDYLTKPFAFAELLARIRALLRRHRGEAVETQLREFAVLEYLMRNAGHTVTRTALIEHAWDIHFDSDTNLVDVYIRYLRRKIDDPYEPKLIHTVRGVGYVLRVP